MDYLPLFLDLRGKDCLVVGGGSVALRKIELLARAGADVTVVAERFTEGVIDHANANDVRLVERSYQQGDVEGRSFVVAATDDAATNAQVFADCETENILVNTVDAANLSTAIFPSIVDRDPVLVAVSTGGRSPTLARVVRGWLEARLSPRLGALAEFVARDPAQATLLVQVGPDTGAPLRRFSFPRARRLAPEIRSYGAWDSPTRSHHTAFRAMPGALRHGDLEAPNAGHSPRHRRPRPPTQSLHSIPIRPYQAG